MHDSVWIAAADFGVDLLLMICADQMTGGKCKPGNLFAGAIIKGIYVLISMMHGLPFLRGFGWYACFTLAGCAAAFGIRKRSSAIWLTYTAIQILFQLIVRSAGQEKLWPILILPVIVWLLDRFPFYTSKNIPVQIQGDRDRVSLNAIYDTGNMLRDPVSGERVLVVSANIASQLTGLTAEQLRHPLQTISQRVLPGLRLIPYHTVGQTNGMMLGMRFHHIKIGGNTRSGIVAFAPEGLNGCDALTGGLE